MYAKHMPLLRDHGMSSYEGFSDVVTFVLLTIRQSITLVPDQMKNVRRMGAKSPYLWGWKIDGYRALQEDTGRLAWEGVRAASSAHDAIVALVRIPGLQITKAAFVAQMLGFQCACMDSRNLRKYGHNSRQRWRWEKRYSQKCLQERLEDYLVTVLEIGDAQSFWDEWCEEVANDKYETPHRISAMHVAAVSDAAWRRAARAA